uniref:Uncharacterized protein n=1 Tax=Megaselia scalaris TaxID=36166 RepID=T1H4T6_MEGSC
MECINRKQLFHIFITKEMLTIWFLLPLCHGGGVGTLHIASAYMVGDDNSIPPQIEHVRSHPNYKIWSDCSEKAINFGKPIDLTILIK